MNFCLCFRSVFQWNVLNNADAHYADALAVFQAVLIAGAAGLALPHYHPTECFLSVHLPSFNNLNSWTEESI